MVKNITNDFKKLIKDLINDLLNTFPEYYNKFTDNELEFLKDTDANEEKMEVVFKYCLNIYPERFFDILYENEELFLDDDRNTKFFKNIDFKDIWKEDISDNTKKTLWKYLQLILFCITNNLDDTTCFKDTAKLFEAIDENELKQKLEEVVSSINSVFDKSNDTDDIHEINNLFKDMMENMDLSNNNMKNEDFEEMMKNFKKNKSPNFEEMMKNMDISGLGFDFIDMMKNMENGIPNNIFNDMSNNMPNNFNDCSGNSKNIPNPDDLQDHLKSLMDGKIGQLAQEIANDTAKDLDIDPDNVSNIDDVFAKLFKNPGKLMGMIKKVSSKLDEKLKSGELKETELMKEASDLVDKMKNTPGMKNMENMLNKMGVGGLGGKGKVNMNLFQSMMKQNIKKSSQKDRMKKKLQERQMAKHIQSQIEKKLKENRELQSKDIPTDKDGFDEYIKKTFNIENSVMKKTKMGKKKRKKNKKNKK